jgi:hypothetical protein
MTLKKIPSMGGTEIGEYLRKYASEIKKDQCVVEVGSWFGAGTYQLCQGVVSSRQYNDIHVYDRWTANKSEIEKAEKWGIKLQSGDDILPYVKNFLSEFSDAINITYKKQHIKTLKKFTGGKIGLYVDDASKRKELFDKSMSVFKPHFAKGCILILMDFYYYEHKNFEAGLMYQKNYMLKSSDFEFIQRIPNSVAAIYKYKG